MDNYDVVLLANSYGGTVKVRAVQGDTGRTLTIYIADMEIPAGSTANFYALKPSGSYVQKAATLLNGAIMLDLDNQILAEEGEVKAQVEVECSGENVKTFKFIIAVDGSLAGDWPESNNDVTFLDALKNEMEEAVANAEQAAALANAAALTAQNLLAAYQAAVEGTLINDETPSNLLTYSSQKIEEKVAGVINDSAASTSKAYSSQKTSSLITAAQAAIQEQIDTLEDDVDSLNSKLDYEYINIEKPANIPGMTNVTNYTVEAWRLNGWVRVYTNIRADSVQAQTNITVATLPVGFRIRGTTLLRNYITQNGVPMLLSINSDGQIQIYKVSLGALTNDWALRQDITYPASAT